MKLTKTRTFRFLICPTLFLFSVMWALYSGRTLSLIALITAGLLYLHFLWSGRTAWVRLAWVAFIITTFLPFDVSLQNYPGPPRFVPLVMGYPSDSTLERAKRGEVILGGCLVRGNEPRWVWVW